MTLKKKPMAQALKKEGEFECTIHLAKHVHNASWTKKAKKGVMAIRKFVKRKASVDVVNIDPALNKVIWCYGKKNSLTRIRLKILRKLSFDQNDKKGIWIGTAYYVPIKTFKGLNDTKITDLKTEDKLD